MHIYDVCMYIYKYIYIYKNTIGYKVKMCAADSRF